MKTATIKELKQALAYLPPGELVELCLRLSKFKKENKELLTYLLFEANNETAWVSRVKQEMHARFAEMNTDKYYYIKKSVRKILRETKKYIRYSKNKETEVELLLYFCDEMINITPSIKRNSTLKKLYQRQIDATKKAIAMLHPDLQYDYESELHEITTNK